MYKSILLLISSNMVYILCICAMFLAIFLSEKSGKKLKKLCDSLIVENGATVRNNKAPGPAPLPVIGNLACLDGYEVPYQAFSALREKFGDIISLKLGSVPTIVVNGIDNIKEVMVKKGAHFDGRPNFRRYHQLFSGNKENSLAFCDWSEMQKMRREMLIPHTFPRNFSTRHSQLNSIIDEHLKDMLQEFASKQTLDIKDIILETCANIFLQYFTSRTFSRSNPDFQRLISNFDKIFYEVNQGYAADFLPFLLPLHRGNIKRMSQWSEEIREIILHNIVGDRCEQWQDGNEAQDYLECLIENVKSTGDGEKLEWNTALFALEDIVGGHSAVGNFLIKVFGYVATRPDVQKKIQNEIDALKCTTDKVGLNDKLNMPYTEAVIVEAVRMIASPIVPHVANQDSTIAGFDVPKDTLIFLNNYDLSMSPKLWDGPEKFIPDRFIRDGRLTKPDYFIPFGIGRRSCMGYKMVQMLSFSMLANTLSNFDIVTLDTENYKVQCGSLAMPKETYRLKFLPRRTDC